MGPQSYPQLPSGKVLIVDADREYNLVLARHLRCQGHDVISVPNGSAGLLAADDHAIDVVIVDRSRTDTDGHTFLQILREDRRYMTTPVILLRTGAASPAEQRRDHLLNADECFNKSLDNLDGIVECIERQLPRIGPPAMLSGPVASA